MGKKKKHKKLAKVKEGSCGITPMNYPDMVREATMHLKSMSVPDLKTLFSNIVLPSQFDTHERMDRFKEMVERNEVYGSDAFQPTSSKSSCLTQYLLSLKQDPDNPNWKIIEKALERRRDWEDQRLRFLKGSYTDPDEVADMIVFVSESEKDLLKHTRGNITPLIREKFKVKLQERIAEEEEEIREHRARYETYKRLSETFE